MWASERSAVQHTRALLTDVVITRRGSVAWIAAYATDSPGSQSAEVRALSRGRERLVDSGARIVPGSLALSRTTLYWTNADTPRSSTFR